MATRLQPCLALLVEKKRQELETSIQEVYTVLTRLQGSLGSDVDQTVACVDDFHRECRAISRLSAELQTLESVAKTGILMSRIAYENRRFASVANTGNGEVTSDTIFHYHQEGDLVWATYGGGSVVFGTLIAKAAKDGTLDMRYQHLNRAGDLMTGTCQSSPEVLPDGRLRLREVWQWTSGDCSRGESLVEEIRD